jgi:tagatose 6-phosphate kinase
VNSRIRPVVVITPNPAIDVSYLVETLALGETNRVAGVRKRPGGKGVNVALALQAIGVPTRSVLPLGGGAGDWMIASLADAGLDAVAVPIAAETRTTVAVIEDHRHPTLLNEAGPVLTPDEWDAVIDRLRETLADASMLIVSGSLPPDAPADTVGRFVAAAHDAGVPVLVDASGPALLAAARAGADILKPNEHELTEAVGIAEPSEAAAALLAMARSGGAGPLSNASADAALVSLPQLTGRLVVVSRGADGIVAFDDTDRIEIPAVRGVSGNPTGAGDAATAGLAAALLDGDAIAVALRRAAALGAAAVLRPVAGEVDVDAYRAFLARPDSSPTPSRTTQHHAITGDAPS